MISHDKLKADLYRTKWTNCQIFALNGNILISKGKSCHLNLTFKFRPSGRMNHWNSAAWMVKDWVELFCNLQVLLFSRATSSDCYKSELMSMLIMMRISLSELNKTTEGLTAKPILAISTFDICCAEWHVLFWTLIRKIKKEILKQIYQVTQITPPYHFHSLQRH